MATLITEPKAIVIGAGPVGCLSAIALAKQGWNVEIYEGRAGMPPASSDWRGMMPALLTTVVLTCFLSLWPER